MSVEVKMPQLGESVFEGTVGKWLKAVGDHVERYEPLLEVITDKVDTEVTASDTGTLLEIIVPEGETVKVGTVLARLGAAGEVPANAAAPSAAGAAPAPAGAAAAGMPAVSAAATSGVTAMPAVAAPASTPPPSATSSAAVAGPGAAAAGAGGRVSPVAARVAAELGVDLAGIAGTGRGGQITRDDVERAAAQRSAVSTAQPSASAQATGSPAPATPPSAATPVGPVSIPGAAPAPPQQAGTNGWRGAGPVRDVGFISPRVGKLAAEHGVNLGEVVGTGKDGRITSRDVEDFIARRGAAPASQGVAAASTVSAAPARPASPMLGELIELTPMRRSIADHMVRSKATSPHVTTVHEVDMGRVMAAYEALKGPYTERGVKLTLTAIVVEALAQAIAEHPLVNSSWTDAGIQIHRDINIGMAVALPQGLIVPVIKHADEKNLQGLARDVTDLAARARAKQLKPDDVQGGTFTLTNYGTLGSLFGTPVISQPQTAILGAGAIKKRVVVIEGPDGDAIGIRPMMYLSLTFDHRVLDGGSADPFMQAIVRRLEHYEV